MIKKYFLLLLFVLNFPMIVFAISSANFLIEPLNIGNSGGINANSTNFLLEHQQIGDFVIDGISSVNYNLRHGYLYPDAGNIILNFTAIPEKRIPLVGNNGTKVVIDVYAVGGAVPLHSYSYYDTNNDGEYSGLTLAGISAGTYDIAVKGYAHLRKRISNVVLNVGINTVDFTLAGTDKLLCGDIYTNGAYVDGDNKVNSIDVTYLVSKWAINDVGVSDERADVDENGQVNSLDMTKVVNNYAKIGD